MQVLSQRKDQLKTEAEELRRLLAEEKSRTTVLEGSVADHIYEWYCYYGTLFSYECVINIVFFFR